MTTISLPSSKYILAPLTKGGNIAFRRLCADFGAEMTISEMAYARGIVRGERKERALLRRADNEKCFGVQLAAREPEESLEACQIAVEHGADFIDINCGCPIHEATRKGMGSDLLRKPRRLETLIKHLAQHLTVPLSVKIRTGWSENKINVYEIARLVESAGASMLTVHGRSREQRYSRSADWSIIKQVVEERTIPVVGNGDILTVYEARDRMEQSSCSAIMLARGALIKPWIFKELHQGAEWLPSPEERVEIYFKLATYMKEYFGDDELGKKKAMRFLPWHFSFFSRFRPLPESYYSEMSSEHPLIQTRLDDIGEDLSELECVLRSSDENQHLRIAESLWNADSAEEVCEILVN